MYKIKILTHVIRLSDGHVMSDWINVPRTEFMEKEAEEIKASVRRGEYDSDRHAVRMRRYPKQKHEIDVELWTEEKRFW